MFHTRFYHCFHPQVDRKKNTKTEAELSFDTMEVEKRLADIIHEAVSYGLIDAAALAAQPPGDVLGSIIGATVCVLEGEELTELARGYALCSVNDQYSRRKGRLISEGRALKSLRRRLTEEEAYGLYGRQRWLILAELQNSSRPPPRRWNRRGNCAVAVAEIS